MSPGSATWPWERLARSNAPSHAVLVEALQPRPGERWLDIGTGSGGTALRAARAGAIVTGVDIAEGAVASARKAASEEGLHAQFEVADVQALPFEDGAFDVVASAFGANFAADHAVAAGELARVCRPGGRLGMTIMPMDSRAGELWTLIRTYEVVGDHPADWAENADALLGRWFDLDTRRVESPPEEEESAEEAWELMSSSLGPLRSLLAKLDAVETAQVRDEFFAIRSRYEGRLKSYVLVLGTRRHAVAA